MDKKTQIRSFAVRLLSYILVAAVASAVTWFMAGGAAKLTQLSMIIDYYFVGELDKTQIQDAAAQAMVEALDDRWSYYIPAADYQSHVDNQNNSYTGVGITIIRREDEKGFDILSVVKGGPAEEAGIMAGDIVTHVEGTPVGGATTEDLRSLIIGERNTKVEITVLRGEESLRFSVTRKELHEQAAYGTMLEDDLGYVAISNFHTKAGSEIIAEVEALLEQGAKGLIFDVRYNPGGYTTELVEALDYLLPEGDLFRMVDHRGKEQIDKSDADCVELPMAVLMNGSSYSAAEFFAAALSEYDWAVTVGERTSGKGYFQYTLELVDGSAVNLSSGRYFTPNGLSLAEVGGLVPDIPVEPAQAGTATGEDPQLQAAIAALREQL